MRLLPAHAVAMRPAVCVFIHCIIFILSANVYRLCADCRRAAAAVVPDFKVEQCIDTQGPVPLLTRTRESRLGFQFLGEGIRRWGLKVVTTIVLSKVSLC